MKKQYAALAATAVLATSLAACSSGNTIQPPAPAAPSTAATQSSAPPTTPGAAQFGGTVTWPGGVKVTAAKPVAVTAGQYAAGAVEGKIVLFKVSITNGTSKPLNASLMGISDVSYGAAGTPAKHAFDGDKTSGFFRTILPGETQTVTEGFGIPASGFSDVRAEITGPDIMAGDQPAVFKGKVG